MKTTTLLAISMVLIACSTAFATDALPAVDLNAIKAAYDQIKAAKDTNDPSLHLILMGVFTAALRHVIALWHQYKPISSDGRDFLPYVCTGLGVVFFLIAHFFGGLSWSMSIFYGLVGPLSVAWNELISKHVDIKTPADPVANKPAA